MSILKQIAKIFTAPSNTNTYWAEVKCNRCGELIRARVNLNYDLSVNYDDGGKTTYFCRKILIGDGQCFQRVEVELTFDKNKRLVDSKAQGGSFVENQ